MKCNRLLILIFLMPFCLIANETKKAYDPWYTGPLISPSASNMDIGQFNIQPYLYFRDTYGAYNKKWGHYSIPDTFTFNAQVFFQMGLTHWMDLTIGANYLYKEKESQTSSEVGDTSASFGFQIMREKEFTAKPNIRFTAAVIFPTGKYNNLNPRKLGIDSSGSGSWEGMFSLNFSKIVYWFENHPIDFRLSPGYIISSDVSLKNFNTYGGGFGTRGTVSPGRVFTVVFSFEYSFTQRWVYAMDFVHVETTKATFRGHPGVTPDGNPAVNTHPSSNLTSIAPAIEYNFNENLGAIGGVHFSIRGRNATEFVSGIISATYTF